MSILKNRKILITAAAVIIIVVCAVGGIFLFGSEREDEPSLDEIISDKLSAYETDLLDSLESLETNADVASYLVNWGKNKKINTSLDISGNVIYTIKAAEGHEDVPPCVIICGYDAANMSDYTESMAVALTAAKNSQQNCSYKVIFCPESNGEKTGTEKLSSSHFTDDTRVFYLGKSGSAKVSQITGGYEQYELYEELQYTEPSYDKAYKIRIKNVPSEVIGSRLNSKPNAIKILGNLLANFKSTSMLFEISSFYGGEDADMIPSSAVINLVINSSDTSKFESKMNNAIEKFMDKYSEDYPEIEYTYEETDMPSRVFTKDETDNLVSLMYTALNGVYNKDDDGNVVAITNMGKISSKDGMLRIKVAAMSCSTEYMDEISDSYRTISGLCNVKYKCTEKYDVYNGEGKPENDELLTAFESAFKEYTGDSEMKVEDVVEFTPLTILSGKNEKMAMLFMGVTEKTKEKYAGTLVTFLYMGISEEK